MKNLSTILFTLLLSAPMLSCNSTANAKQSLINHPRQISCAEAGTIKTQQQQIYKKLSSIEDRMGDLHAK
tara:strand:- start:1575 stop:1784 length:210 start_codon:yes stop_codon:yes gene_type:complete